ncbi:unnamed protein product [Caenorhabditis auriculariae]|uniref:Uncharacterized protein n=1 Tax=Caenorhabditis auriculariae TaxID=2777116 RepID=A0A8S1GSF9_9PELO|nr:unnamed protein product [Caenorhabditis auriculariae]
MEEDKLQEWETRASALIRIINPEGLFRNYLVAIVDGLSYIAYSVRFSLNEDLCGDVLSAFWAWHDLWSFLIALGAFSAFWGLMTFLLSGFTWYVESLGMVSLLVEASLGSPQLLRNFQRKSTQGMSIPMVMAWLCGDLAKTGYFVATGSPVQFWVCAILQITIDILILLQVFIYRKNTGSELPYSNSGAAHATID